VTVDEPEDYLSVLDLTVTTKGGDAVLEIAGALDDGEGEEYDVLEGPLEVHVHVMRERLKGDFGSGSSEGLLKESADAYPNMRLGIERGLTLVEGCDGVVWRHGAISALLVTCAYESISAMHVRIRRAEVATVGDLIRNDLEVAPVRQWTA
jgi:hypothetical protein